MTPASRSPSPAATAWRSRARLSEDRLGAELAIAEAHALFVEGAPLQGGGGDPQPEADTAKGVILARAVLAIAREDAPGPVVRAILPQGPHAPPRAARRL